MNRTRKKTSPKAKEPVRIRLKQLRGGNQSIYFDMYSNGKRTYSFPKLYIVAEKTEIDKETNRETLLLANKIKARMILELTCKAHGFESGGMKQTVNFIEYIRTLAQKKRTGGVRGVYQNYMGLIKHLIRYRGKRHQFSATYKRILQRLQRISENGNHRHR